MKKSIKEGSMSDVDLMAKEAASFKEFVKEFYKEFRDFPKTREAMKWLEDTYKSVSEGTESDELERVADALPQTVEEMINEISLSSAGVRDFLRALYRNNNILKKLGFSNFKGAVDYIRSNGGRDWDELRDEATGFGLKFESVNEALGNDKSMLALVDILSNSMEHYDEKDFLQTIRGGQGWSGIAGFQNSSLIPIFKSIYKKYWTVSPKNRTNWSSKDWIKWLKPFGLEESVNEDVSKYTNAGISKFAVAIASLTATKPDVVQKFVDTHNLNIEKLYQFLKKENSKSRFGGFAMDFVTALSGKPGNPIQKKLIKMFQESVNEAPNTGERIQNLNNRIKALKDKISATKSPEQKKLFSDRLVNALQTLSNIKKDHSIKAPHRESIKEESPCWDGYKQVGMKDKGGKQVPNCVPNNESVTEEAGCGCGCGGSTLKENAEPTIISQLKDIVKHNQSKVLVDPKSGKKMRVDLYSASAITQVYDAFKQQSNKDKFVGSGLIAMQSIAMKLLK